MNTDALLRGCDLALPQATIARVSAELLAHGRVRRGYLGVATQPLRLPAAVRDALGQRSGALVVDVAESGPRALRVCASGTSSWRSTRRKCADRASCPRCSQTKWAYTSASATCAAIKSKL